jgi:hypothetical protein
MAVEPKPIDVQLTSFIDGRCSTQIEHCWQSPGGYLQTKYADRFPISYRVAELLYRYRNTMSDQEMCDAVKKGLLQDIEILQAIVKSLEVYPV